MKTPEETIRNKYGWMSDVLSPEHFEWLIEEMVKDAEALLASRQSSEVKRD